MIELTVARIEIDLTSNTLHLVLHGAPENPDPGSASTCAASIDVGIGGRLIGVDLGGRYVPVMEPEPHTETLMRSADIEAGIMRAVDSGQIASIVIPRRGQGYEITYPSGNQ